MGEIGFQKSKFPVSQAVFSDFRRTQAEEKPPERDLRRQTSPLRSFSAELSILFDRMAKASQIAPFPKPRNHGESAGFASCRLQGFDSLTQNGEFIGNFLLIHKRFPAAVKKKTAAFFVRPPFIAQICRYYEISFVFPEGRKPISRFSTGSAFL